MFAQADALLDHIATALIPLGADAPSRQFVSPGVPSADCEQVTVHVSRVGRGMAGAEAAFESETPMFAVTMEVTYYGCVTVGELDMAKLALRAQRVYAIGRALVAGGLAWQMAGRCDRGIGALVPINAAGDFVGWSLSATEPLRA